MDYKQGYSELYPHADKGEEPIVPSIDYARKTGSFELYQKRKAENTIRAQKAHLAIFETYLLEVGVPLQGLFTNPASWHRITSSLVENFVEWQLLKGYAIKSVNDRLSTIKRYAALACRVGELTTDELFQIETHHKVLEIL